MEKQSNEKNRQYANMGLSGIFEYHDEKRGIVTDLGMHTIFHLLHSLAPVFPKPKLG